MSLLFLHRPVSSTIVITTSKQIADNYRGVHNTIYFIASQDMIRVNVVALLEPERQQKVRKTGPHSLFHSYFYVGVNLQKSLIL